MAEYRVATSCSCGVSHSLNSQWRNKDHWHVVWPDGDHWCYEHLSEALDRIEELDHMARTNQGENNGRK